MNLPNNLSLRHVLFHWVLLLILSVSATAENHYYVDVNATGAGTGLSLNDAFVHLQDALAVAVPGDSIHVEPGTYKPDLGEGIVPGDRHASFRVKAGVSLRGASFHDVILSGDLMGNDIMDANDPNHLSSRQDNAYHVVSIIGEPGDMIPRENLDVAHLSRFVVTGGHANADHAPDNMGAGILCMYGQPSIFDCNIIRNTAINGGGLYIEQAKPRIRTCVFSHNSADRGAGMMNRDAGPDIAHNSFQANTAVDGGGICNIASPDRICNPIIRDCDFENHTATRGGAIYSTSDQGGRGFCQARISENRFSGNWADFGGGIYSDQHAADTITDCNFTENVAIISGGALFVTSSRPECADCNFVDNTATSFGGAVFCDIKSQAGFRECLFEGNIAMAGAGGAVRNDNGSQPSFANCLFNRNLALMSFGGAMSSEAANPVVSVCHFERNYAIYGGAVHNGAQTTISFSACKFFANFGGHGGGTYSQEADRVSMQQCLFAGNHADYGGALYEKQSRDNDFMDSIFTGNHAYQEGGAVFFDSSNTDIFNCTFSHNVAPEGPGLAFNSFGKPSDVEMVNTIVWNEGPAIWNNDRSVVIASYSNIRGGWSGENNISRDPGFMDADGPDDTYGTEDDDVHLRYDSICIDTASRKKRYGNRVLIGESDFDGDNRLIHDEIDIGADEFSWLVVDSNTLASPSYQNGSPHSPYDNLQAGIDFAQWGQTVLVLPGRYLSENDTEVSELHFDGRDITVTSLEPDNPDIVSQTLLAGPVIFEGSETSRCQLRGFRISHAEGGIYGHGTQATIRHCQIVGNGPCGATVLKDCNGLIENCLITDNNTFFYCGVFPIVSGCGGVLRNCTIANNASGVSVESALLENNILYHNAGKQLAVSAGHSATIRYCNIQGGFEDVVGNGYVDWGPGNFDTDPQFVSLGQWPELIPGGLLPGDYHLQSQGRRWNASLGEERWTQDAVTSPCIDAGNPLTDTAQERLPDCNQPSRINMGAYGGTLQASIAPCPWHMDPNTALAWAASDANDLTGAPRAIKLEEGTFGWGVTMSAGVPAGYGTEGVEFYFECTNDSRFNSGWTSESTYTVLVGLHPGVIGMAFRVKARDARGVESEWSTTLPVPN